MNYGVLSMDIRVIALDCILRMRFLISEVKHLDFKMWHIHRCVSFDVNLNESESQEGSTFLTIELTFNRYWLHAKHMTFDRCSH